MTFEPAPTRCYVASPLGFTDAGRIYYREHYLPALAQVVEAVDPWSLTSNAEISRARAAGGEHEMALEIGRRNIEAIRSCSMLVAYLEGQEPDSGTVAEVGFAAGLGLLCFGLRTDARESGERGVSVNLQVESFVVESGGRISGSLAELLDDLRAAPTARARTFILAS